MSTAKKSQSNSNQTVWRGSLNALIDDVQAVLAATTDPVRALDAAWVGYLTLMSHAAEIAAEYAEDGLTAVGVVHHFSEDLTIADRAMDIARAHRDELDDEDLVAIVANTLTDKHEAMSEDFAGALVAREYSDLFLQRQGASNTYIEAVRCQYKFSAMTEDDLRDYLCGSPQPAAE